MHLDSPIVVLYSPLNLEFQRETSELQTFGEMQATDHHVSLDCNQLDMFSSKVEHNLTQNIDNYVSLFYNYNQNMSLHLNQINILQLIVTYFDKLN